MKFLAFLLMIGAIALPRFAIAGEQVTYTFEPSNPSPNDLIRIRLDIIGCISADGMAAEVLPIEKAIEAKIQLSDVVCDPTDPNNVTPQYIDVGQVSPGIYTTRIFYCFLAPPPEPGGDPITCNVIQTGSLNVTQDAAVPSVIPSTSLYGLIGMFVVILALGMRPLRSG